MRKIWRYLNYDMIDTCILSFWIIILIMGFRNSWVDYSPYIMAGIFFSIIYTAGMIWRHGAIKDIINDYVRDEHVRHGIGLYIYANRNKPYRTLWIKWIFFIIWTGTLLIVLIILK